jgi:hypothetical protein
MTDVDFPSLKGQQLLAVLRRRPLSYRQKPGKKRKGSHWHLVSPNGYPDVAFWCHDKDTMSGSVIKEILVAQAGLTEADAAAAIKGQLK